MEAYKDAIIAYGWFYPIAEFLGMLALALLLAYGGFRVRGGAIQIGVVVAFFQYGMRFFRPIQDLSEKYNIMQSAMAAAERVFKLLDTPVQIQSPAQPVPFRNRRRRGIRPRLVRLQGRRLGVERRQLPHRTRRNHRRGGPHRRGKNHHRQPAAAILRSAARRDPHRRNRYSRF
jgi:ABC-type multidrug transport system fused ATPase/permease subunit